MEVINDNASMLSNYEVHSLLADIQAGRGQRKPNKQQQQLATITYETVKYLENSPCVNFKEDTFQQFLQELEPFKLTKAEKSQIINHCPTSAVEIQLIVEESEERLSEDQIYELLEVVGKYLPSKEESVDNSGEVDEEEEGEEEEMEEEDQE